MKTIRQFLRDLIGMTGTVFMGTTLALWLGASVLAKNFGMESTAFESDRFGAILLCSFLAALFTFVFRIRTLPEILRVLLHLILVTGDFMLLTVLVGASGRGAFLLAVGFAVLYLIVALLVFGIRAIFRKKNDQTESYTSQFQTK
ncbi:MAG: DUF3021 family protein [Ruminococcus sp.]|nr:DUF3021 family protein [Candidatus Apopatosoma intestinale]